MATTGNQIKRSEFANNFIAHYNYDNLGNSTFSKYAYISAPCFEVEFCYAPKWSGYSHWADAEIWYYNYSNNSWTKATTISFTSGTYNSDIQYGNIIHNCVHPNDWATITTGKSYNGNGINHLWRIYYHGDVGSRSDSFMRIHIQGLNNTTYVSDSIYNSYFKGKQIACCKSSTANDFAYVRNNDNEQSNALAQFKRTNFRGNSITANQVNSLISI